MRAHGDDFTMLSWPMIGRFGMARFLRIYPLNTVILLLMVPLVLLAPGFVEFSRSHVGSETAYKVHNLSLAGFLQSLLLVQTFTVAKLGEWNGPSWSLSAELLGYLFFPCLAWAFIRQRSVLWCNIGAGGCLALLAALMIIGHHANNNPTGIFGAVRMFFCFTAGMLVHRAAELSRPIKPRTGSLLTLVAVGFLALTMLLPRLTILDTFGFALLIVGLIHRSGPVNAVLQSRAFMWLGKISFSFYMIQETLFRIFLWAFEPALEAMPVAARWLGLGAMVISFLIIAQVLFLMVEKPCHRLGRRVSAEKGMATSLPTTARLNQAA